ncbi:unnamed protein product [Adineta steineri]|uniref:Uncharacterized protein n=1 Tax=Adineta steineri TaxID=433720 RepID=A0A815RSU8_9BILA|nr:unnamed protein product [Adineta steineri]CAF3849748.1 unnamed protein product [Adineta steineri]
MHHFAKVFSRISYPYSHNPQQKVTSNNIIVDEHASSSLYKACFENNVDIARDILQKSTFDKINRHEVNGSTALHLAVECEYPEMVRLLLHEYDVFRHLTDGQGRTAFELARIDKIRRLFRRPTLRENRFSGNEDFATMVTVKRNDEEISPERVKVYESFQAVREHHADKIHPHHDNLVRWLFGGISPSPSWCKPSGEHVAILSNVIDDRITVPHPQQDKVKELLKQFSTSGKVEFLIHLFTLETPFYSYINQNKESSELLAEPIFQGLSSLRKRAFKGTSFRGLSMTTEDIERYQWAQNSCHRYLVTNTFCSSTKDVARAEFIAEAQANDHRKQVLMIFDFTTVCLTAIQLEKLSDSLPCIPGFEDEREVLILPRTIFIVKQVNIGLSSTTIYLEYYNFDKEVDDYLTNKMSVLFG